MLAHPPAADDPLSAVFHDPEAGRASVLLALTINEPRRGRENLLPSELVPLLD